MAYPVRCVLRLHTMNNQLSVIQLVSQKPAEEDLLKAFVLP